MVDNDIVHGDKRIVLLAIAALVLLAILSMIPPGDEIRNLDAGVVEDVDQALQLALRNARATAVVGLIIDIGFLGYFLFFGVAVIRAKVVPPPGWIIPFTTRRRGGSYALWVGWGCEILALIFLARAIAAIRVLSVL